MLEFVLGGNGGGLRPPGSYSRPTPPIVERWTALAIDDDLLAAELTETEFWLKNLQVNHLLVSLLKPQAGIAPPRSPVEFSSARERIVAPKVANLYA